MVRIRLMRTGSKKQPTYRIVITDKRNARDSRYIEAIGNYNPRTRPHTIDVVEERALYWLSVGAQPSESVEQLLTQTGTMERFGRLRDGEDMETLVAEVEAAKTEEETIDPRTEYPAPKKAEDNEPVAQLVEDVEEETTESEEAEEESEETAEAAE